MNATPVARARELRGIAETLNEFADLPASAPDAEFSRLLAAKGGSLFFVECAGEEGDAAQRCARTEDAPIYTEFEANGVHNYSVTGRPANPQGRWKVGADGTIRDDGLTTYTLIDGKYLVRREADGGDVTWFVLDEDTEAKAAADDQ